MRIYLAGGESMLNILKNNGAEHVLVSYYYLREKGEKTVEHLLNSFPDVFLDSGAFTLNVQIAKEGISWEEAQRDPRIKNYVEDYARFLDKWGHRFSIHAEIDVGPEEQKTRQREFLEQYSDRILPVIHPSDYPEYQHYLCQNYDYVALGGVGQARSLEAIKAYVTRKIQLAKRYGTRYHGFAITIIEMMRALPFYSCDSTSWLMGGKYGMTFWFDGHRLRAYDKFSKNVRRRFKRECMELGVDWEKFMADKAPAVNKFNLLQWIQYQKFMNTKGAQGIGQYKEQQESFFREHPNYREIYIDEYRRDESEDTDLDAGAVGNTDGGLGT
jgi:hypothetical protein